MTNGVTTVPMTESHVPGVMSLLRTHLTLISYPFDSDDEILKARIRYSLYKGGGLSGGEYSKFRRFEHWVALRGDEVMGALHVYAATSDRPKEDLFPGNIAWMIHDPEDAAAGVALLQQAASWLGADWSIAEAFSLANSVGWGGGLPSQWNHIHSLLLQFDFSPIGTNWLMCGEIVPRTRLEPSSSFQPVTVQEARTKNGWEYKAILSGDKVGEISIKPMDKICWIPSWDQGWWIDWVEVEEPHRGKGIAKQLFLKMANHLRRLGYIRIAGHTDSPEAATLNKWIGMNHSIEVRSYRRSN